MTTNSRFSIVRLAAAMAALGLAPVIFAAAADDSGDRSGDIRVDVVVDMTEAGHKIARPSPDKPVYYLPISVGYKEFGSVHDFQRPPPNPADVEHALALALYEQGYRLMSKEGHPSLALIFWWGYMAPQGVEADNPNSPAERPGSLQEGVAGNTGEYWGAGSRGSDNGAGSDVPGQGANVSGFPGSDFIGIYGEFPAFHSLGEAANEDIMLSLVAGKTINDHQKYPDPRMDEIVQMAKQPRYYVMVSAFDFQAWLHHDPLLLWRAHVSTELWGRHFDEVIGTMITAAAPLFGRETVVPHFISAAAAPVGHVMVSAPRVQDVPNKPAAEK
jgi:hypothetical protein